MSFTRPKHLLWAAAMGLAGVIAGPVQAQAVGPDGLIKVRSAYSVEDSLARMKQDIAAKGILFFQPWTRRSSRRAPASRFGPRRCWSSATRRSACSS
jgi:hypothetical protein